MADEKEPEHKFEPGPDGKGVSLKLHVDTENEQSEEMSELFKEVSDSKPENIQEFFIRLAAIQKVKI